MTKSYIEFRVYLLDGINIDKIMEVAEDLKDQLTDSVSVDAPPFFTQDVTYEVKISE